MTLKLGMQHRVFKYYQVCSNDDPGLTLTYFIAWSSLVPYAFVWRKGKTVDFSETIVVYDLKLAADDKSDKKFPRGCIHVIKSQKNCIKLDFKEISSELATNG